MPVEILSTRIFEHGIQSATVELVISDNAEEDKALEILRIRTKVDLLTDAYLPAIQERAMHRVKEILDQIENQNKGKWIAR